MGWRGLFEVFLPAWAFFADRGHRQLIAAYYDGPLEQVTAWSKSAATVPKIDGIMYTTWNNDYRNLEEFITLVNTLEK